MPKNIPPPVRKVRPDRRISLILPVYLVSWINADLAAGWSVSELVVAALQHIYPGAGALPKATKKKGE